MKSSRGKRFNAASLGLLISPLMPSSPPVLPSCVDPCICSSSSPKIAATRRSYITAASSIIPKSSSALLRRGQWEKKGNTRGSVRAVEQKQRRTTLADNPRISTTEVGVQGLRFRVEWLPAGAAQDHSQGHSLRLTIQGTRTTQARVQGFVRFWSWVVRVYQLVLLTTTAGLSSLFRTILTPPTF